MNALYAFEPEADILTQEFRVQNVQKLVAYNDGLPMTNNYEIYEGYYNIGSIMTPEKYQKEWGLEGENAAYAVYLYDTGQIIAEAYANAVINQDEEILGSPEMVKEHSLEVL